MLIVNAHSFVDVITNSSTELFVCNTDKTIKQIADILQELLTNYNKLHGERHSFRDTFQQPVLVTSKNVDKIGDDCYYGFDNKHSPRRKYLIGNIVIYGVDDNSIPYEMFDEIQSLFGANRYHLG